MPDGGDPGHIDWGVDWGVTFRQLAGGWLFSDVEDALPETAILPLENPDLYDASLWDGVVDIERRHRSVTLARHDGVPLALLSPRLGAPAAAMTVEAAADRGVRTLIGLGYCGAVDRRIACGDLLAPSGAVAGDGVSAAYCPERYPAVADHALLAAVHDGAGALPKDAAALHDGPATLHDGLVHSIDAVFLQDSAFVARCRALRVAAIDMETSAVLTAARLRGMRAATILVASDHPGLGMLTDPEKLTQGMRQARDVALRVVSASGGERRSSGA